MFYRDARSKSGSQINTRKGRLQGEIHKEKPQLNFC